jgi:hypothetical protein
MSGAAFDARGVLEVGVAAIRWHAAWVGAGWALLDFGPERVAARRRQLCHAVSQAGALLGRMMGAAFGLPVLPTAPASRRDSDERDAHDGHDAGSSRR